ncbi:hypothetical protein PI125_g57 [Phytophthora idaei]|nr:hypothetical protein PI125_g57 [Phytophthora idaei]
MLSHDAHHIQSLVRVTAVRVTTPGDTVIEIRCIPSLGQRTPPMDGSTVRS